MSRLLNLKLIISFFAHLLLFFFSLYMIRKIFVLRNYHGLDVIEIVVTGLFFIVLYAVLWKKLYSKAYHFYLTSSFSITAVSLVVILLIFVLAELCSFVLWGNYLPYETGIIRILLKYSVISVIYMLFVGLLYSWIVYLARLGFFRKNTMVVGLYDERIPVERLFQDIKHTKNYVGQIFFQEDTWMFRPSFYEDLKPVEGDINSFLLRNKINELIICMDGFIAPDYIHSFVEYCYEKSIGYYLIPNTKELPYKNPWDKRFNSIPTIERYCPNRDSLLMLSMKRLLDILVSATALAVLSPVFAFIALLIIKTDGRPVIYASKRIGIHGEPIRFYKFRTMVKNAEKLKKELLKYNERPDGPLFKMADDPRITPIGRVLRKYSLDELPQFWNVLRGDMSLIGPRPHLSEEVKEYSAPDYLRLECIPGISCLPQIRGRNELGFREWVDLDLEYRKNWSFIYDLKILWKTVLVVLSPLRSKKQCKIVAEAISKAGDP